MKKCFKCQESKPLSEYYKHNMMADGHLNKCKDCTKKDAHKNRDDNLERAREYDRARGMLPHRVAAREAYSKTAAYKASCTKGNRKYRQNNPNKYKAHTLVNNAIRNGKLFKEPCEICQETKGVHGHHDDYAKPLNIRWLCLWHHLDWHKTNGEGLNP